MYFQLHPFSRLISRIFSVRSARVINASLLARLAVSCPALPQRRQCRRRGVRHLCSDDRFWRARSHHWNVAAIEMLAVRFRGETPAPADQEIDDVVAHAVIK